MYMDSLGSVWREYRQKRVSMGVYSERKANSKSRCEAVFPEHFRSAGEFSAYEIPWFTEREPERYLNCPGEMELLTN